MSGFNLFYAHNQFSPFGAARPRGMGMMGGNVNITENITVKNGPSGFWGFMGGLMNGLGMSPMGGMLGMPMMGGLFGMMNPMGGMFGNPLMGCNFGTGLNSGVYGMLNAQGTASPAQADREARELESLKALYPDCKIGKPIDGKYYLTDKNGEPHSGTFDELTAEAMNKPQGTDGEKKENITPENTASKGYTIDNATGTYKKDDKYYTLADGKMTEIQKEQFDAATTDGIKYTDGKWMKDGKEYEWKDNKFTLKTTDAAAGGSSSDSSTVQQDNNPPAELKTATPNENKITKDDVSTILTSGKRASLRDLGNTYRNDFEKYSIGKIGDIDPEKGFPKTITLKADSGWRNQVMTLKEVKDGVAIYQIGTGKGDRYRLEKNGNKISFTQRDAQDDQGYGKANWNRDG